MKRVVSFLTALVILVCITVVSASALDYGCDVETVSEAVYLKNLDTGAVVFEKNAGQQMYPASTTKIMTYAVVADHVEDFDSTMVEIKEDLIKDLDPESTVMGLSAHIGEQYSIRDLLYGMMLPSGNDAALVLADYVGGDVSGFVDMMNAKAAELGCTSTHFKNPHGLYDSEHYTTAEDLAKIAEYARTTQSFMEITNTVSYTPARFDNPVTNTNYMIASADMSGRYYYPYTKGIKTGYLDEAGKCLVTTAQKDQYTYLCVALGAQYSFSEDVNYAMLDTKALYEWAFDHVGFQTVYDSSEVVKTVEVKYGKGTDKLNVIPQGELVALLPVDYDQSRIRVDVECDDSFEAPIAQGQALGKATVYYDDLTVGTTDVVAGSAVELDKAKRFFQRQGEWIKTNVLLVVIIVAVLLILIILLIAVSKANKRKRARQRARRRYRD